MNEGRVTYHAVGDSGGEMTCEKVWSLVRNRGRQTRNEKWCIIW